MFSTIIIVGENKELLLFPRNLAYLSPKHLWIRWTASPHRLHTPSSGSFVHSIFFGYFLFGDSVIWAMLQVIHHRLNCTLHMLCYSGCKCHIHMVAVLKTIFHVFLIQCLLGLLECNNMLFLLSWMFEEGWQMSLVYWGDLFLLPIGMGILPNPAFWFAPDTLMSMINRVAEIHGKLIGTIHLNLGPLAGTVPDG
jgi:hypothetical protein